MAIIENKFDEQDKEVLRRRDYLRQLVIDGDLSVESLMLYAPALTKSDFDYARLIIREEAKKEEREKFEYYMDLYREAVAKTTYPKGLVKVEKVYLPFPTSLHVLKNKELSMKTYGALLLHSSYGGKVRNLSDRYIYFKQIEDNLEEIAEQISTSSKKISVRTLKKYIRALSKCSINILEPMQNYNGDVYYRLNYTHNEKYFTLIHDTALRKLINAYSENALRVYLVILYSCFDFMNHDEHEDIVYSEKNITQDYICEHIGLKTSSRKLVSDCVEALAKGGFIKVRLEYSMKTEVKDGNIVKYPLSKYYYIPSDDYLKKNYISR